MRRVLVTHVESPVGRRVAKALFHDPDVGLVVGLGTGAEPSFLAPYRGKVAYQRLDLAKARHLQSFLHSERFARVRPDSVIHLPFAAEQSGERVPGGVHTLVSETRRLVEECAEQRGIDRFVYLSSAFVYEPVPGNGNVISESQLLGFEGERDPLVRAWIDADLVCQGELHGPSLCMTILRAATIVTEAGDFLNSPPLAHRDAALGYDPMLAVVSDRDVARALVLALHADRPGIYNIAGNEVFPRSQLAAGAPRSTLAFGALALAERLWRRAPPPSRDFDRYGMVPSARLAAETLGFEPQYRIEVRGSGAARRIDTIRCR
ncbi:MAG TPA: NAD-dependent epimerase/dehydratase family protein [Myxococcota bacterium]|nr:NAD-dependent epimerase/dehydratase family protein [Myxococcota bacterium]